NPMGPGANSRGNSRKHIFEAIDASLQRLDTDYVDLYQIHRFDPSTPVEETMEALHDVVKAGKARYIGASSMYAWQFAKLQAAAVRSRHRRAEHLRRHHVLLARAEQLAQQAAGDDLALAAVVGVGGVIEVDSGFDRAADDRLGLGLGDRPLSTLVRAEAHHPHADA
ncbi:MAG TPA: aldo/keto reductase, partial [Solirubrobacteraceae bacterium]